MGQEDPLEEEMAPHSSIHAWEIPWTEELGGLHTVQWAAESYMTKQLSRLMTKEHYRSLFIKQLN